jgi:hypothetical protein
MTVSENIWLAIIGLIGTLFGGIGAKWYENYRKKIKTKEAELHTNRLHNTFIVYNTIEKLVEVEGIDRALLLMGSNGGSEPRPGHVYKVQAIHGTSKKEDSEKLINRYLSVRADAQYIDLLKTLLSTKEYIKLETKKMSEGKLKTYYLSEGVTYSNVYYLGHSKEELYYCSIASFNKPLDTPLIESTIDLAVTTMRNAFDYYAVKD